MAASLVMKSLDPKPPHTYTDHKANLYSKPMAITMMQLVLSVFYMHSFTSLIFILLTDTRFHKRKFSVLIYIK